MIDDRLQMLKTRWEGYVAAGSFECFVEFAVTVNCLTEHFNRVRLPGLVRICQSLEQSTLACFGAPDAHPIPAPDIAALQTRIDALLSAINDSRPTSPERRVQEPTATLMSDVWIKPRTVWLISASEALDEIDGLARQLRFFGFQTHGFPWQAPLPGGDAPLAVIFLADGRLPETERLARISAVRAHCGASQLIHLDVRPEIENIVALMRAGIDFTIPPEDKDTGVLNCILDLVQQYEPETYRVLVVEDSRVAGALIQRTLSENGITSRAIRNPAELLTALQDWPPDLILMDMHMPGFTGVEATRVLRQMPAYGALPIVYLSGESDVGMQVEALRLGGDQFLSKPFNPVLLAAVVKTKIERFRETQRSTRMDGLTGLLNHSAAKATLAAFVRAAGGGRPLTVAMIDIDHFKSVNDTYGHPAGDRVIRYLAWLFKGRLRSTDLIGRYGGEEFILALSDVDANQARKVIDRIRQDFASMPHPHQTGTLFSSFSAGVASYPEYDSAESLTQAADDALLRAKRAGRNQVVCA